VVLRELTNLDTIKINAGANRYVTENKTEMEIK